MKILIIEDEPKVVAFLKQGLEEQGYEVSYVYDGQLGENMVRKNDYDLILLDVIIPFINGYELCKKIREIKPTIPIMMLTALDSIDNKINGFDAGADDYLIKPFEFRELIARIRALTTRNKRNVHQNDVLKVADLEIDLLNKNAIRQGKTINLTAKEFGLLEYLARNKGRVVSRSEIAQKVWEISFDTGTNIIDVYINILRKKIDKDFEPKLIHTRVGLGYIIQA